MNFSLRPQIAPDSDCLEGAAVDPGFADAELYAPDLEFIVGLSIPARGIPERAFENVAPQKPSSPNNDLMVAVDLISFPLQGNR